MRAALPCLNFTPEERLVALRHGFITFPQFLDNGYTYKHREQGYKKFKKALLRYGIGYIQFAVLPDDKPEEAQECLKRWPDIEWIHALHDIDTPIDAYEWVGFPHREEWRNYSLTQFLDFTEGKKRWYLGFWDESRPQVLLRFDGFDTTIPETYSGEYGKLWMNWGESEEPPPLFPTIEIFTHNVLRFKLALCHLFRSTQNLDRHLLEAQK